MPTKRLKFPLCALVALLSFLPIQVSFAETDTERILRLEQRLLQLEQHLEKIKQNTDEVRAQAPHPRTASDQKTTSIPGNRATFDILTGKAWRELRWTREKQWEGIKQGVTEEKVIELLGYPPRSVDSLRPRVDKVYWYETDLRARSSGMRGKISFRKGRVISVEKPEFTAEMPVHREPKSGRVRLP